DPDDAEAGSAAEASCVDCFRKTRWIEFRAHLGGNAHRQGLVAPEEAGVGPLRLADPLDPVEAFQHLLPDDLELQPRKPHADAAMNAEAERQMIARTRAVDDELVRAVDDLLVAIAGYVPHHDAVTLPDRLAAELGIGQRGAAHMRKRRLPADHLRDHGV